MFSIVCHTLPDDSNMCTLTALGGERVHVKLDNWHLLKSSLGTLIAVLTSVTDDADRVHMKCFNLLSGHHYRKRSIQFYYYDNY